MRRYFLFFIALLAISGSLVAWFSPSVALAASSYDDLVGLKRDYVELFYEGRKPGGVESNGRFTFYQAGLLLGGDRTPLDDKGISAPLGYIDTASYTSIQCRDAVRNFAKTPRMEFFTNQYRFSNWGSDAYLNMVIAKTPRKQYNASFFGEGTPTRGVQIDEQGDQFIVAKLEYFQQSGFPGSYQISCMDYTRTAPQTFLYQLSGTLSVLNTYYLEGQGITVHYPEGYEGEALEVQPLPGSTFTPKIMYTADTSSQLKAYYMGQKGAFIPTSLDGKIEPKLRYTLYDNDDVIIDQQTLQLYQIYEFDLPGVGDYRLTVEYIHPGPPSAPFQSGTKLLPVNFNFSYNGTQIIGTDHGEECTPGASGTQCEQPSPYKDCSAVWQNVSWWEGVPDYVSCIGGNIAVWFRNTVIDLFVPSYQFFNAWKDEFFSFLASKFGFVYQSLALVGSMFTGMVSSASTTQCIIQPAGGTLFGSPVRFDMCQFEAMFPAGFKVIQGVVIALTAIAVIFAGYSKYLSYMAKGAKG